jgi:hypothetical protein
MVGAMNRLLLPFACGSAIALGAVAGELPDPTRPPAALRPATPSTGPMVTTAAPLVLQSVLFGEGRKPTAIINGRVVELGDSFDGMRLVRVFDSGALLSGPNGATTLALTPASEKVAATTTTAPPLVAMTKTMKRFDAPAALMRTGDMK